jgi:hypothetical protein
MNGRSRLVILMGVIGLVLTIVVGNAGASRAVSDTFQKRAAASHAILGWVGRPPLIGGPFGNPGDYPGTGGSTAQTTDSSNVAEGSTSGDDDNCLLQVIRPRTAC